MNSISLRAPVSLECYHCGDPVAGAEFRIIRESPSGAEELDFCCQGCIQAYNLILDSGNQSYYSHRTEFAPRPSGTLDLEFYSLLDAKNEIGPDGAKRGTFLVEGIHCASCVWLTEKVLLSVPGVTEAEVHLSTHRAFMAWDPTVTSLGELARSLYQTGYQLRPIDEKREEKARGLSRLLLKRTAVAGFFAGNNMLIGFALYAGFFKDMLPEVKQFFHLVSLALTVPVFFYSAMPFFKNSWTALKNRVLVMDLLTATGISIAFFYSLYAVLSEQGEVFFDSVCFIVFVILAGRYLEDRLRFKSMIFVESLKSSHRRSYRLRRAGELQSCEAEDIIPGDVLTLRSGDIVPVDGRLVSEKAELDQSMLTGEFKPEIRTVHDPIISGAKILSPEVQVEVLKKFESSSLKKICELAESSMDDSPPAIRLAARAGRWFIAFVLLAAAATFLFWLPSGLETAVLHTVTLLIVACPCALSLAIPTAFTVAVQGAYSRGILLKKSSLLERLSRTRRLIFDKTGTLTEGDLGVKDFKLLGGGYTEASLREIARLMQQKAILRHPVSRAFLNQAVQSTDEKIPALSHVEYTVARGVQAKSGKKTFYLGSFRWMEELGLILDPQGFSYLEMPVYMAVEISGKITPVALFVLEDRLRPEAKTIIQNLKRNYSLSLLSGDRKEGVVPAAQALGIKDYVYSASPEEKLEYVNNARKAGVACMIGDGVNDSAALAGADAGISFADASEINLNSADILLLNQNLKQLEYLFELSRRTRRKIIQNLLLAFGYNVLLLPLAFMGLIIPLAGAIFMSLSSLTVVLNSLSLLRR